MLGMPVILRANGGMMPVYTALLPVKAGFTSPPQFVNGGLDGFGANYNELIFNKSSVYPATGATATPTSTPATPVPPCLVADLNCDGIVDIRDYGIWRQHFGETGGAAASTRATTSGPIGDINGDGIVDIRDYGIWRQHFGETSGGAARRGLGTPSAPSAPAPTAIPSPASTPTPAPTSTPTPSRSPSRP